MALVDGVFFFGFVLLAVGLSGANYAFKKMVLGFGACGGWLLLGFYSYYLYLTYYDLNIGIFFWFVALFSWAFSLVSAFDAMGQRGKREPGDDWEADDEEKDVAEVIADAEKSQGITTKLRKLYRPRRVKRKKKKVLAR